MYCYLGRACNCRALTHLSRANYETVKNGLLIPPPRQLHNIPELKTNPTVRIKGFGSYVLTTLRTKTSNKGASSLVTSREFAPVSEHKINSRDQNGGKMETRDSVATSRLSLSLTRDLVQTRKKPVHSPPNVTNHNH